MSIVVYKSNINAIKTLTLITAKVNPPMRVEQDLRPI